MRPYMVAQVRPYVLSPDAERALKPGQAFRECAKDCPEMVVVPAGEFMMGSPPTEKDRMPDEGPQHRVTIARPFAVSKYDVSFIDWDACVSVGGCPREGRAGDVDWGRDTRPVIYVSWDDARQYVAWLSQMTGKPYRLLSDAEFEYAARAGTQTAYSWGDDIGENNANCVGCGSQWTGSAGTWQTAPVGSFAANRFGLYDMVGNVWKWVHDVITPITTEHPLMVQRGLVEIAPPTTSAAVPGAAGLSTSARPSATGALPMTGITPWASGSAGRCCSLKL